MHTVIKVLSVIELVLLHVNLHTCYFNVEGHSLWETLTMENLLIVLWVLPRNKAHKNVKVPTVALYNLFLLG